MATKQKINLSTINKVLDYAERREALKKAQDQIADAYVTRSAKTKRSSKADIMTITFSINCKPGNNPYNYNTGATSIAVNIEKDLLVKAFDQMIKDMDAELEEIGITVDE